MPRTASPCTPKQLVKSQTPRKRFWLLLVAALLWITGAYTAAIAQSSDPLSVEEVLRLRRFGLGTSIAASADGHWLAYATQANQEIRSIDRESYARTGIPPWAPGTAISIVNLETGETRCLTDRRADSWLPVWSPRGHDLAFLSSRGRDGQARLWVWDGQKDELRSVSDVPARAIQIEWTPDSQKILLTTLPQGFSPEEYVKKLFPGADQGAHPEPRPDASTVILYRGDHAQGEGAHPASDPWNLDMVFRDLSLVELSTGNTTAIVSGQRIETFRLSPDGSRVAYALSRRFEKPGSQQVLFDLALTTIATSEQAILASEIRFGQDGASYSWSPEGAAIGYQSGGPAETVREGYVVDLHGSGPRNVTHFPASALDGRMSPAPLWDSKGQLYFLRDGALWQARRAEGRAVEIARVPDREITHLFSSSGNLLWEENGRASTVVVTYDRQGKQDGFYGVNLANGKSTPLLEKGQCYTCSSADRTVVPIGDEGKIAFVAEDAQHDEDLWLTDGRFRISRRLTQLNPQFDRHRLGDARLVNWLSDDGEPLEGALLLPAGYQPGVRYPLIVWVYGGSWLSKNLNHFGLASWGVFNMQLFATRGYAVLLPDTPQHVGTPMLDLAKTVLPGVNKVIEMGIADPRQLGVMGHSNGGYSVLSLIVQTHRFQAAVSLDGTGDKIAGYGQMGTDGSAFATSLVEQGHGALGDTPWRVRDRYVENSPVFYLDRVETPLLLVHGANDSTVASFLGDEVFVDLRRLGKKVEYAKYKDEGHTPLYWRYANQVDLGNRILAWFEKHLQKRMGP